MTSIKYGFCILVVLSSLAFVAQDCHAQSVTLVYASAPDASQPEWQIQVAFNPDPTLSLVKRIFLVNVDDEKIIKLGNNPTNAGGGIYIYTPVEPLEITNANGTRVFAKHYELNATVENLKRSKILSLSKMVELIDLNVPQTKEAKQKAKSIDDADIYVALELNGAHGNKTSFSTEIKLQKYMPISPNWFWTPFFTLNASSDAGADPDSASGGVNTRYIFRNVRAYFDNAAKIESERDFGNSNFIYDTRLTFLPDAIPKGFHKRNKDGSITTNNVKVFFNPYVGGEFGKNLNSPLKAAEGDGIARLLAGADFRVAFYPRKQASPDINWTTSYTRRWLLTDELAFKVDDDGSLQLRTFGSKPRDHVSSKVSYKLSKFLETYVGYEWGQVPPSYKLVDHRFRAGFAYKFKWGFE
jgi:hypothetical protein